MRKIRYYSRFCVQALKHHLTFLTQFIYSLLGFMLIKIAVIKCENAILLTVFRLNAGSLAIVWH